MTLKETVKRVTSMKVRLKVTQALFLSIIFVTFNLTFSEESDFYESEIESDEDDT